MRREGSLLVVLLVYLAAFYTAYLVIRAVPDEWPLWMKILAADLAAMTAVFLCSLIFSNSSIYDPYWSVAPPVIIWYTIISSARGFSPEATVLFVLMLLWSIRLTTNWIADWSGLRQEDWRYRQLRSRTGRLYWPLSFLAIHLFPTLLVFSALMPAYRLILSTRQYGGSVTIYMAAGAVLILTGTIISFAADSQLRRFRQERSDRFNRDIMQEGLWSLSRHPNYFGENLVWFGLWIYSFPYAGLIAAAAPLAILALFHSYSIPVMERRLTASRPAYQHLQRELPRMLPIPRRRKPAEPDEIHV